MSLACEGGQGSARSKVGIYAYQAQRSRLDAKRILSRDTFERLHVDTRGRSSGLLHRHPPEERGSDNRQRFGARPVQLLGALARGAGGEGTARVPLRTDQ